MLGSQLHSDFDLFSFRECQEKDNRITSRFFSLLFSLLFSLSLLLLILVLLRPQSTHPTHTTHTKPNTRFIVCVTVMFQNPADGFCAERAHGSSGSPKRRRQRRLRSWLRHERQTVAVEVAAALHHSRDARSEVAHEALRGQKAARSGEEAGVVTHNALRGLKTLPPGMRPEQLPEAPGPQRCDRTVRGTSVGAPLLAVQSLRGFDGVDDTAAKFLLQQALKMKKEEEEEKERKEKELQEMEEDKKAKKALAAWTARRKAVTDEMHALLDVWPLTPAQRKREVVLVWELDVIDAARPPSLPMRKEEEEEEEEKDDAASLIPLGVFFLAILHLALCFLPCLQARDARHHGRYGTGGHVCSWLVSLYGASYLAVSCSLFSLVRQWIHVTSVYSGFCGRLLKCSVFSAMLGSTVALGDDFVELLVFSAMLGSTVALGDDFVELLVFSTMLGSTVALGDDFLELFVFSAMLGSTVVPGDDFVEISFSAQCLVRHLIHGAASLRGHSTGAALGQGCLP